MFPPHRVYCEPFLGGGSILLNKIAAEREIAGDLNAELVNLWLAIREDTGTFIRLVDLLGYSRETFEWAAEPAEKNLDRAARFLVRNRMSRGGLGKDFAWSDRLRGGQPGDVNAWETIKGELPGINERIRRVEFRCCDAARLIKTHDGPDTLFYCDPPYLPSTRSVPKAYAHEMTRPQHEELLRVLLVCRGKVFLSGYANPLYDEALKGWTRHEFEIANHSGQGKSKQRRIECLWESPPWSDRVASPSLDPPPARAPLPGQLEMF